MLSKRILTGVLAVVMVFSVVAGFGAFIAPSSAHADTMTAYVYTRSLTVGSTGADVIALQTMLVAQGYLVMPVGVPMGYFGTLTQAAVAKWQASVGISPAAGYFGPISQAYVLAHMSTGTFPAGCTSASGFSTVTGQPCNTGSTLPAGCTSTVGYSPVTGVKCDSTGAPATGGNFTTEGTLSVYQGTVGSSGSIQTNVDVPVYSLQLRAQLGDVRVDRMDLQVADNIGATIENPANFISNIKVVDDAGTILVNRNVTTADFITGTSSTIYYVRLSSMNFVVAANTTKNLTVKFTTSGSIDTSRTLTIKGYGTASLLAYSGPLSTASYYDISGITTTQTFIKPGNTTVVIGVDQSNPLSKTIYIDPLNGAQKVEMLDFNTNTTTGSSQLSQVIATVNATGTAPTSLYLYQGSTVLSSRAVSGLNSTVTFDNINTGTTQTGTTVYSLKADYPSNTATGTVARVNVTSANFINTNGNVQTSSQLVQGNQMYFYPGTPNFALSGKPSFTTQVNQTGSTTQVTATFNFTMTPYPGSAIQPLSTASDFIVQRVSSAGATTTITAKGLTITPSPTNSLLAGGQTYTVSLTANDALPGTGVFTYKIISASSTVKDVNGVNVPIIQTWGLDDWHTDPIATI